MKDRRGFLRLLGTAGLIGAGAMKGQEGHGDTPPRVFTGTSRKGDVQEALQQAVAAAERSVRHPDAMVEWSLKRISGRRGGIAGFNEVTVTIDALVR